MRYQKVNFLVPSVPIGLSRARLNIDGTRSPPSSALEGPVQHPHLGCAYERINWKLWEGVCCARGWEELSGQNFYLSRSHFMFWPLVYNILYYSRYDIKYY